MTSLVGQVKWFDDKKGYGFIVNPPTAEDIFVHYSEIVTSGYKTLEAGDTVVFSLFKTSKGLQARHVYKMNV